MRRMLLRRDVIANVFLVFTYAALLFAFRFSVYFSYNQVLYRSVSNPERICSVFFVLLWLAMCIYAAYFKNRYMLIGGVLYGFLAYIPGIVIPMLTTSASGTEPGLVSDLLVSFAKRIYELVNAPMVGISILFPPGKNTDLSKYLLPVLIFIYIGVQIFRFYRTAYLAEQLHLEDPGVKTHGGDMFIPMTERMNQGDSSIRPVKFSDVASENVSDQQEDTDISEAPEKTEEEESVEVQEAENDGSKGMDAEGQK